MLKRVTKDFETRSKCDLKKSGAYKYSLDPSTQPTCLAFKIHGNPKVYFLPFESINKLWQDLDPKFRNLWMDLIREDYEFSAHNSFFEKCIYDNILVARYGWPKIPLRLRRCTAAKAAACAIPRNLEGAGDAMKLAIQKDKRGYSAVMATCKPTKQWTAWKKYHADVAAGKKVRRAAIDQEPPMFLEPHHSSEVWKTLYTYCKIDVKTEELLDDSLPDLIPAEQEVWFLNQKLNWRGLKMDIPTVQKIVRVLETESKKKLEELDTLTMGLVSKPGATKSIIDFLSLEGVELPNLRKQTVDDHLKRDDLNNDMRRLLEIRKALSLTSTKKYYAFLARANDDERVRDILLYHGASTGRDTGTGIQPQNFPRPLIDQKEIEYVLDLLQVESDSTVSKWLHCFYGEPATVFSALLRSMIIPTDGWTLFVADFSKIEVAMLWWLAGNSPGVAALDAGKDPYTYQASKNTGKTYEEIEQALEPVEQWAFDARQLGKAQVLGAGFGMGWSKFLQTAWDVYRLKLTDEQAQLAIKNYREANAAVPALWKSYESAAIAAVETGSLQVAGRCKFFVQNKFLWVELPSGRRLAYREPQIAWRESDYGTRKTLEFWAVNSKTKKWSLERTWGGTLTENIVQAAARDLMMYGIVRLEKAGYRALLTVHDEAICERKSGEGSIHEFIHIFCQKPEWAEGLPLTAKGWTGNRYRK